MNQELGSVIIRRLESDEDVLASFPAMRELRTHIASQQAFLETVRRMEREGGYRLSAAIRDGEVQAVAGYRVGESLAWGRFLYVDDLVTLAAARSQGLGKLLCQALREEARREHCTQFHLDSGVQRSAAHRFYMYERMEISCFHFQQCLH